MGAIVTLEQAAQWAIKALDRFQKVEDFRDLEVLFLKGQGLSPNTYRAYREAAKGMYEHTEGLHPLQWTPELVEDFYDAVRARNTVATAYNRMAGLKNFCKAIKAQLPFWESPFDIMGEALKRKLATTEKGQQKAALYRKELHAVMDYVNDDTSLKGLQNKAMVLTLVTTGLRAAELCSLTYDSLEHDTDTDTYYLTGIGKGSKPFEVELYPGAWTAILEAFRAQFKRDPRHGDYLFYSTESYHGKAPAPMTKAVLWVRLRQIGDELKRDRAIRPNVQFSAHLFRRTYLTQLHKAGMGLRALQHASRHSNVETLMSHYVDDRESTRGYLDTILRVS